MSGQAQVEATGDTVGEARWAALHELERRYPNLDRGAVEYQIVSEGERGLLGVGYEPARVVAVLHDPPPPAPAPPAPPPAGESETAARVRVLIEQVVSGLGLPAQVTVEEREEQVLAVVTGGDLGLLIGRHGQTIDAVQYLANAAMHRGGSGVEVVIDAQGYRERRERMLHGVAAKAAAEARRSGHAVALESMTAVERKIVHMHLKDVAGVQTTSEGAEPNRHVVVLPDEA